MRRHLGSLLHPLLALVVAGCAGGAHLFTTAPLPAGARAVGYCELERDPQRFDGALVLVSAIYDSNRDQAVLLDPGCRGALTWVELDPGYEPPAALRRRLSRLAWSDSARPRLTVLGRFDGRRGFGAQGRYHRLTILSLLDVARAAWPVGREASPAAPPPRRDQPARHAAPRGRWNSDR